MIDKQQRQAELNRKIITVALLEMPGMLMFGLGLFALFADGEPLLPILAQPAVVTVLLAVGGAIMVWCSLRIVSLAREFQRANARPGS